VKKNIKHILYIENEQEAAWQLIHSLKNEGFVNYQVDWETSLSAAIDKLSLQQYDAVLTDFHLSNDPDTNIVSSLLVIDEDLPIVVLTNDKDQNLACRVVQSGAKDFLNKATSDTRQIVLALERAIQRKLIEHHLAYYAQVDDLTGLPNRNLFKERLSRALIRADRNEKIVALMIIDIDRFKHINDSLGHEVGDELLRIVGKRLSYCVRDGDTVARLGGDEFTILLEEVTNIGDPSIVANRLLESMMLPIEINGSELFVTLSIGITLYPIDNTCMQYLLRNADNAMYRAKEGGRNCYRYYTTEMNRDIEDRIHLDIKIRQALAKNEFELHYQPKFNIHDKQLVGAEALLRWNNEEIGSVSPTKFIPIAEETGLIQPITEWVVSEACRQNSEWQLQGYSPIIMAINLSPKQFNRVDIADILFRQIIFSDLAPKYVELEITEGALMEDINRSQEILKALKDRGICISIDDFGTGYSSLNYLKKFPIDTLKIDQSFVRDIMVDNDDAAIVSAVIAMAKSLRLNVIAEGVETKEQLNFLDSKGCCEAQGYFLGKPVAAKEFKSQFLTKNDNNIYDIASNG